MNCCLKLKIPFQENFIGFSSVAGGTRERIKSSLLGFGGDKPSIAQVKVTSSSERIWSGKKFHSPERLAEFLLKNLLYRKGEIYAFSKPGGVCCTCSDDLLKHGDIVKSKNEPQSSPNAAVSRLETERDGLITIESALPYIAHHFNEPELVIAKFLPWYVSGPVIMSRRGKSALNLVRNSIARAFSEKLDDSADCQPGYHKAVALCVGKTANLCGNEICYAKTIAVRGNVQYDVVLDENTVSNKMLKRGMVRSDRFIYKTLGESSGISLVEFSFRKFSWDLPRLFLMRKGIPILGDSIYQKRVARILGKTVSVLPSNASVRNQYIPLELLNKLKISIKEYHQLPMFFHIFGIELEKLHGSKSEDVFISDSLPVHFDTVLNAVGLRDCIEEKSQ